MRKTFIKTLIELAENDKSIYLLCGDIGFNVLEEFADKFPRQFINCGIAEQNMMGVAAGLAISGKKVYVYSIIPFVTVRCLEQIKNDVCFRNLDVKIVGYATGFSYGAQGTTHHAIEDVGILRSLPNMTILSPADLAEEKELILQSYQTKNPTYIRLDKGGKEKIYNLESDIIIAKPSVIKEGKDGVIIATGSSVEQGINIIKKLEQIGYDFKLISMHTLKPIDSSSLLKEIEGQKLVFTIEEHNVIGGLGSCVAEILLANGVNNVIFKSIGICDKYPDLVGEQDYLRVYCGIDEDSIYQQIIKRLKV
ncbi:MAG: transketolase C-terminal domain-containing protein [bacterium]